MDLSELPIVGSFVSAGALLGDLVFYSGDLIVALLFVFLDTIDLWIPLLSTLDRLAPRYEWIPEETVSIVLTIALFTFLAVTIVRIRRRATDNDN